jgi:hypothetical protein
MGIYVRSRLAMQNQSFATTPHNRTINNQAMRLMQHYVKVNLRISLSFSFRKAEDFKGIIKMEGREK